MVGDLGFDTERVVELCRDEGVAFLGVFGSVARGEAREESDIDVLVRFAAPTGYFGLVTLKQKMEEVLGGRRVDLVTEGAISGYIKGRVLNDLQVIYGTR